MGVGGPGRPEWALAMSPALTYLQWRSGERALSACFERFLFWMSKKDREWLDATPCGMGPSLR